MMFLGGDPPAANAFWAWADSVIAAAGAGDAAGAAVGAEEDNWVYGVLTVVALTMFMEIPFTKTSDIVTITR